MPDYRRNRVPGGTYFFTVNLLDRHRPLLVEHIGALRESVRRVRELMPFHIDAWVVLPEHMHVVWTLPECDADFPRRWQAIKMAFSKRVAPGEALSASHMDYVHFNPVKHGLVQNVAAWPYSSFHRCVAMGLYPAV